MVMRVRGHGQILLPRASRAGVARRAMTEDAVGVCRDYGSGGGDGGNESNGGPNSPASAVAAPRERSVTVTTGEAGSPTRRRRRRAESGCDTDSEQLSYGGSFFSDVSVLLQHVGRPEPDDADLAPSVGLAGGSCIMINTVVGGGISLVATPFALRCLGVIPFVLAEFLFAALTIASMCIIAHVCHTTGSFDLCDVTEKFCGRAVSKILGGAVFLNTFGVVTAFIQIAFDACSAMGSFPRWVSYIVIGGLLLATARLSWEEHVRKFEQLAGVCLVFWVLFTVLICIHFLNAAADEGGLTDDYSMTRSLSDVLLGKGLAAINLTWTCQFNAAPLFSSLVPCEESTMQKVSIVMSASAVCIYLLFGMATYFFFGNAIADDVMVSIAARDGGRELLWGDWAVYVLEALLGVSTVLTIPFFMIEGRNMLNNTVCTGKAFADRVRIAETVALIAACYALAAIADGKLATLLAAIGILANILQWIVPGLLALRVYREAPWSPLSLLGALLLAFGLTITVSGLISLFRDDPVAEIAPAGNETATARFTPGV